MLLSQKLANFSKGEADVLRKGMGKKKKKVVDAMYPKFVEGCAKNGHSKEKVDKIWKDWEAFASYAFNKSHSTCYALVAFQTAYLKAHHPAEFMASVLTHNKSDISKITFFLRECKRMGLDVLGPDVNESGLNFTVNKKGQIRFGMSALKGVGEGPVEAILEERKNGAFVSVFDMTRRLNLRSVNKKCMESLALGGGFDCFKEVHRAQYFAPSEKYDTLLEHTLKYGNAYQHQKADAVNSLFGATDEVMIPEPKMPVVDEWNLIEKLSREKEVTGIFISGHPLDNYELEVKSFTNCTLEDAENHQSSGRELKIAGIVTRASHRISKKGTGWGDFAIQDYNGSMEFRMFSGDYMKFKGFFELGTILFIKGNFRTRWNSDDEYDFKIKEVEMLEDVAQNKTQSMTLTFDINELSTELVNQIDSICKENKGKHRLLMVVEDREERIRVSLRSKERKVNADSALANQFTKLGLRCKLN